jgi:arsenate reductase
MSKETVKIYHNPRCSKSRNTLAILEEKGVDLEVIEYLNTPLDQKKLKSLCKKLNIAPEALIRKGEAIFKENYAGKTFTESGWIDLMVKHPILIERPIVENGSKAAIGRPPENILAILD